LVVHEQAVCSRLSIILQNGCVLQAKIFSENVACFKNG